MEFVPLLTPLLMAAVEATAESNDSISGDGWTAIGVIATAICGLAAAFLVYIRSRSSMMEREIRKLRAYSWENAKRLQRHNNYLEAVIEAQEDHINTLEDQIWRRIDPPPAKMVRIPRPKELDLISDLSIADTEKQTLEVLREEKEIASEG